MKNPVRHVVAAIAIISMTQGAAAGKAPRPIWIDADPACFVAKVADVDDCWALLMALDAPELRVVGISSTFGNVDQETAHRSATAFLRRWAKARRRAAPQLYAGARSPTDERWTPAARALSSALKNESLSILALGPLTNVARVMDRYPNQAARITRLVAVMGRRPGELFLTGGPALHVHDLNVVEDPMAVRLVLRHRLSMTLVPFSAGRRVRLDRRQLATLGTAPAPAGDLARASIPWAMVWRHWLGGGGMPLFDSAAVAALIAPELLDCQAATAKIHRRRAFFSGARWYLHAVVEPSGQRGARPVRYCARARPMLQDWVMKRLTAGDGAQSE